MTPQVTAFCHIKKNQVFLNGKRIFSAGSEVDMREFVKAAFRNTGTKYPKFFKMDDYSKLGFLAVEVLMKAVDVSTIEAKSTGIVLSNNHSTLTTDQLFQDSIQSDETFFPSPSVFVYTLPNIMAGEIAIRHHFTGENAFFVSSLFDPDWHTFYINQQFESKKISACLSGWVEMDDQSLDAFVYFVEKGNDLRNESMLHTVEELNNLYKINDK